MTRFDDAITNRVLDLMWERRISQRRLQRDLGWADHRLTSLKNQPGARWLVQELVEAAEYLEVPVTDLIGPPPYAALQRC